MQNAVNIRQSGCLEPLKDKQMAVENFAICNLIKNHNYEVPRARNTSIEQVIKFPSTGQSQSQIYISENAPQQTGPNTSSPLLKQLEQESEQSDKQENQNFEDYFESVGVVESEVKDPKVFFVVDLQNGSKANQETDWK